MKKFLLSILALFPLVSFAFAWDNNQFLDDSFWNQNPTNNEIIDTLYGDGNLGSDKKGIAIKN